MVKDRNGTKLNVGDPVKIIPGMAINDAGRRYSGGHISAIDGEYIMVDVKSKRDYIIKAERYGCELWSMKNGEPGKDI